MGDKDEDLTFARNTSESGQFAQQLKLRMKLEAALNTSAAALRDVANIKLRRLLAYNYSFGCTDVKIFGTALCYKTAGTGSAPRRMGPSSIPDVGETRATAKFQSRSCVRLKV